MMICKSLKTDKKRYQLGTFICIQDNYNSYILITGLPLTFVDTALLHKLVLPAGELVSCMAEMNYYLTRKLRAMGPDFFEKSCSRTLRSICNHLRRPLQKQTHWSIRNCIHTYVNMHTQTQKHTCGHLHLQTFRRKIKPDNLHTCHQKMRVQKTPSLWGWSGRKPGRGVRTTAA